MNAKKGPPELQGGKKVLIPGYDWAETNSSPRRPDLSLETENKAEKKWGDKPSVPWVDLGRHSRDNCVVMRLMAGPPRRECPGGRLLYPSLRYIGPC